MANDKMLRQSDTGTRARSRQLLSSASLAAVLACAPVAAHAEDRYWDANGTGVGSGGTGTWNLSNLNWSPNGDGVSGPFVEPWNNGDLDDAIFGGTAGTVTIGVPVTIGNVTFSSAGYTLDGSSLTLAGVDPTIAANSGTSTINSVIAGTAGLTKTGNGILHLTGANTFSGGITFTGQLWADDDASLGALGNNLTTTSNATLRIDSGTTNRTVGIASGTTLTLLGAGAGSAQYSGAGNLLVSPEAGNITLSNDSSNYTGTTRFNGRNGVASLYFSSVRNLGEASALGAPTTVANGTIHFQQSSQYSDSVIYIGDGDSSDRDWTITTSNSAGVRNEGSGTLTITGNMASSGSGTVAFGAQTADFELLGVLSGGDYSFGGNAGRSITLGDANTYTGLTTIGGVTVSAGVLTDSGLASSLGTGAAINLANGGTLSYTGIGASSDRTWSANGAVGISNDGTGALALGGDFAFDPLNPNPDMLTLGGSFGGTSTFSGVMSGTGGLVMNGSGTWLLSAANTRTGTVTVENGTLQQGNASAFGTLTGLTVNGGILDLNGIDLTTGTLNGAGGQVAIAGATLTVDGTTDSSYAGSIAGAGDLTKVGAGTLTLSGANSYTGATNVGGGTLALDFTAAGAPTANIIDASSTLNMSGGTLSLAGAAGEANVQTFNGLNITAGNSNITGTSAAGGSMTVNLGAINRTGGLINFNLPAAGNITTSNAGLGGWATVNGTDYAKVVGGNIVAFAEADYTDQDDASLWTSGQYISDSDGDADSYFGIVASDIQLAGLQFTTPDASTTVTIAPTATLGVDGTIIVAPSVLTNDQTIAGGFLTGAAGGGLVGVQQNGGGTFTIASTIIDNGADVIGFTKGGTGIVRLAGANTYTGATTLSGGRLEVTSIANGGAASSIGQSAADSSNLVLENGTFAYVGGTDAASDRGFTLVNAGAGAPTIEVIGSRTLEFSGLVTSPDDAGLTKTGWGTLVLSNASNDYVGITTITGSGAGGASTLSVNTLADGGQVSGIGASASDAANLVLSEGGRLEYTGGTVTTDRGFTLGSGGGRIGVTQAGTTLTVSGTALGAGRFTKDGDGVLVLAGANLYTGGTAVNAGTLRAGSAGAFGSLTAPMAVNAGATLDLGGFDIKVGVLNNGGLGGGNVSLGASRLTTGGVNGTFSGEISGTGGLTQIGGGTQVLSGCNNTYTGSTEITGGAISVDCLANGGQASGIGASSAAAGNLVIRDDGILAYTGLDQTTDRGILLENRWGYVDVSNAATTLEFTGAVEGPGNLVKRGNGTLMLSGSNTFAGAVQVQAGTLQAGSSNAFDQGTSYLDMVNVAGAQFDLNDYDASFSLLSGGGAAGGDVDLGSGTLTITVGTSSNTSQFAGAIHGTGNLVKDGTGVQRLTGCASDYTGTTTVSSGYLEVTCLEDGGVVSSMGTSSADASNLVIDGGAFRYLGSGDSTNRQFTLGSSVGSALESWGSGAINFTSSAPLTFSAPNTTQTLTLGGTNSDNNTLATQLVDNGAGVTSLTKANSGTWILTNSGSTYTGVTTISGGVLGVDKLSDGGLASSIGASSSAASNLVIGNGSTLRYTGAGDTTNRLFTLAAGTSFIESSGTGAIVFTDTGPVTLASNNQARTIALGGTNTGNNTLAGTIGDAGTGVTTLAKNDSGNWVLTGDNTFTGNTVINDGNLVIGNGGTTGNAGAGNVFVTTSTSTLSFNRSDTFNFTGAISGPGSIAQIGSGTTVLTATNSIGAARVDDGMLQVDGALGTSTFAMNGDGALSVNGTVEGATAGSSSIFTGDAGASTITVNAGGTLRASGDLGGGSDIFTLAGALDTGAAALNLGDGDDVFTLNDGGAITGSGVNAGAGIDSLIVDNAVARTLDGASITAFESLAKQNSGLLTLTGDHSYSGGTTIAAGSLGIGDGGASGTLAGEIANNGALEFNRSGTLTIAGEISGTGSVDQLGSGTTVLTANNSYTGGTTISAGALQLGDGGTSGFITGDVANNGSLIFNRSDSVGFGGLVSGTGSVAQNGSGIVTLTADNSYGGATTVNAGTLLINGDQSAATGLTSVASGATLGGIGTIGGDVNIANGGNLAAGSNGVGTLVIAGGLTLDSGSILNMEFGQADVAGGALNDLIEVGGDLALDGATINVSVPTGGTFGPGIYRVFNYDGDLLNDDLGLGTLPGGSDVSVQTSITGQVNLVNSAGLALSFWDGDGGPKFDDTVNGGNGTWHVGGTDNNWTGMDGAINAAYADGTFAIFAGTGGTVTVDNDSGAVTASGMQFASDGYQITGDALSLIGPQSIVQVGDSSVAGAGFTATISAELTGTTQLVKTDAGTLVLTGSNSYTGGTAINGGTLRIASDANLGAAAGGISFTGGTLNTTATFTSNRAMSLAGAGTVDTNAGTFLIATGNISGVGSLTKTGAGTLIVTGDATHTGGTTITDGTLQIGNTGTTGSIAGDILNNAALNFNRGAVYAFDGVISGSGSVSQDEGTLSLTANSNYGGNTNVNLSQLRVTANNTIVSGGVLGVNQGGVAVSGDGSTFEAASIIAQSGTVAATIDVTNGGTIRTTSGGLILRKTSPVGGAPASLNVSGTGSLVDLAGGITASSTAAASVSNITISDGGTVQSGLLNVIGALAGNTTTSTVTITGAGSNWTSAGGVLLQRNGQFSVLDGGVASFNSAIIGSIAQGASALVSGTGSSFSTTGLLSVGTTTGNGILTVADGAHVIAGGGLSIAEDAGTSGVVNIGGGAGEAAAAAGVIDGAIAFGPGTGTINFNHTDAAYDFASAMSGTGAINQLAGVTLLNGDSAGFSGLTSVSGGALYVNNALGGDVTVTTGGALGGIGTIGGNVTVADGALNPGDLGTAPGTLTINGNLDLAAASTINVSFGQANVVGGNFNDLIEVGGDLTLGGTLNVETTAGGSFDPGVYRVINYGGTLTDNGLAIGTIPSPDFYVQTSVDKQVNLVNTTGLQFRYWDGIGTKNDGIIDGGDGLWQRSIGNDNWVDDGNIPNAQFADAAFAVFMGAAGTVTVDRSLGDVEASGMQFLTDGYVIEGDAITLAGPRATIRVGDGTAAGADTSATIISELTGAAALVKSDLGTLVLTGNNSYTGGTAIEGGTLAVSADANLGDAAGGLTFNGGTLNTTADLASSRGVEFLGAGTLLTDDATTLTLGGTLSGAGALTKQGLGTLILTGSGGHSGGTAVSAGTLFVNGDLSGATGLMTIANGATLGGMGTIGGDVSFADGATLAPGADGTGTLTIVGDLGLAAGTTLDYQFGQANTVGGALNDLVNVGGDLVLDGAINVSVPAGGDFGGGIYRVFDYGGTLTDNGLVLGAMPLGSDVSVQTAVAGQVNLVNTAGLTLSFWDGNAGPKNNDSVNGGDGVWRLAGGGNNWTDASGAVNADYAQDSFAVFAGAPGTVTIDDIGGAVRVSGMQFAVDGYSLVGDALTLTGSQATIRVGDGTTAGAGYTATIGTELGGSAPLVKTDAGTLVLSGTNSYTGGTLVSGGTLSISSDANLGAAAGGLALNGGTLNTTADIVSSRAIDLAGAGTITTDADTTLELGGAISGPGALTKAGTGTLILGGSGSYIGGTNVNSGALLVNGDYSTSIGTTAIAGGATLGGTGMIGGDVTLASGATLAPGAGGAGTLTIGGDLELSNGAQLAYEFGEADSVGGALNDLVNVGGNLVLDGTLNVAVTAGGAFDVGVYRVFNYGGALTNNGLSLGTMPAGAEVTVQTSISGQVNLVNSAGLTLNFWDGAAGPKNDGVINGGDGIWQNNAGNDNWTEVTGEANAPYSDGAFAVFGGTGGTVTVDDSLGAIGAAGMQFGVDGYTITGDAIALAGPEATIRVGDGSTAGAGYTATIDSVLTGATGLVKTDAGTLVLGGANTYDGGTRIVGGTVQVSENANLGAATGSVTLEGGTLATSASFASARDIAMAGTGTISTAADTTFTFDGLFSGSGALTKAGTGTLLVTGDSGAYTGAAMVAAGTLAIQGSLGSAVTVADGARLEGIGEVGSLTNSGTVAPGRDGFGTLTVVGGYAGAGGTLEIETALGGDASQTDRLVVGGGTSGTTEIIVTNRGGLGGQTVEGIKIVDVTGTSSGIFNLRGDYVFEGSAAVIAGAYGYRLYQGGASTPTDGDWYLRSALLDGSGEPEGPLYQPGVPLYENYGQVLQSLNNLPTLQERVGNRSWAASADGKATGIWGRMESTRARPDARVSTAATDANIDSWKLQMGADRTLSDSENGTLIAGITGHYGESNASVRSTFGDGSIKAKAYGAGATLTWYHRDGFYADAQAQYAWFDGRLTSSVLGTLVDDNDGTGKAFSLEVGKRALVGGGLTVTPQIQMIYQDADFDSFADPSDAQISSGKGDSLKTRWGISLDHQKEWESTGTTRRSHLYGLINVSYEWLDGTEANVSGTAIRNSNDRLWGEVALGGSLGLNDRVTIYSQASASSPFRDFGNDYSIKGVAGVRVAF